MSGYRQFSPHFSPSPGNVFKISAERSAGGAGFKGRITAMAMNTEGWVKALTGVPAQGGRGRGRQENGEKDQRAVKPRKVYAAS